MMAFVDSFRRAGLLVFLNRKLRFVGGGNGFAASAVGGRRRDGARGRTRRRNTGPAELEAGHEGVRRKMRAPPTAWCDSFESSVAQNPGRAAVTNTRSSRTMRSQLQTLVLSISCAP
jgi:hypothetical protein